MAWRWKLSKDGIMLIIYKDDIMKKAHVRKEKNKFIEIEWNDQFASKKCDRIVRNLCPDMTLKMQFAQNQPKILKYPERECVLSDKEFRMQDCMLNKAAYAACNGSKKNNIFRGYCTMTDSNRNISK